MIAGSKHLLFFILLVFTSKSFAQQQTEIKVLSWNIQMLPNFFDAFSSSLRKMQKIRQPWISDFVKEQDYDVIVFQEVFDVDIKRKLRKNLKKAYPYQVNTKTKFGRMTSNGVLIVSRVPMKYIDHVIYRRGVTEDGMAAKGCTLVEVEKNGVKVHIAGTHLQSGGKANAQAERNVQYKDIYDLCKKHEKAQIPLLIMGDMNTERYDKKNYDFMLKTLDVKDYPLDEEEPYTIDKKNSWNNHSKGIQLDYVFLNARQSGTKMIEQKVLRPKHDYKMRLIDLADHYGVISKLLIRN